VDINSGLFNCHNDCGFKGCVVEFSPKKDYIKPAERLEKLSAKTIKWFEDVRGISNNTLLRFKVTESKEWMPQADKEMTCICFNYYRDEKLINIKFRDATKGFKMSGGAELLFYNLDSIRDETSCVIVEGEIDCFALYESGIYNVVSVPNGASKGSQRLEYLDNSWDYFERMERIVLAVDNDEAGISLRDELARRLDRGRCFTVDYPLDCKDLNEVLINYGKNAVAQIIEVAKEMPLEGIYTMEEMFPIISDWYVNGYLKGAAARIQGFDELLTFAPGQLTIISGIPGHGKDEFANLIMANLAQYENWGWGICGFEETAPQTATKLIEKFTGKSFDFRVNPNHRISVEDYQYGISMVDNIFT
jgi:twinkle protein